MRPIPLLLCLAALAMPLPAAAAGHEDPAWPCVQRKVERLTAAAMWAGPLDTAEKAVLPPGEAEVAAQLALRRVDLKKAGKAVETYIAGAQLHPDAETLGRLFSDAFERINRERTTIVHGIERYVAKQDGLADRIDEIRSEMERLSAADLPDFDRIDELETELDWSERVFRDRNRALTFVCESPVLLEQRAFAVARMLEAKIVE